MSRVRPLAPDDLPALADLWMRSFRRPGSVIGVERYFREVFLEHPLRGDGIASLVYEDDRSAVSGFVGALPRRMLFRGRPIQAAVATQFMVDPGRHRGFAAFELLRALFAGPQDLTFSDGANEPAQRVWERSGGEVARLYSLDFRRVLRPGGYAAYRIDRSGSPGWARALAPLGRALDVAVAGRFAPIALAPPRAELDEEDLAGDAARALIDASSSTLRPSYEEPSLGWILSQAQRTQAHGALRARLCRDRAGDAAGFYVYYAKPRGVSQVLKLAGRVRDRRRVLRNLFADAYRAGSIAVAGQADPRWLRELSDEHARFVCDSLGVLVQSKDREILGAVQRGDSSLSRLDGEWWLRFAADPLVT
jgi:Acetyltransferase (GNAT) domain